MKKVFCLLRSQWLVLLTLPGLAIVGCFWVQSRNDDAVIVDRTEVGKGLTLANPRIPAGMGATTQSGKFVREGASNPSHSSRSSNEKLMGRATAEKELQDRLQVENLGEGKFRVGLVTFDSVARTASMRAQVNMRRGMIEYALVAGSGKTHEALLTTSARPSDLHLACLLLGIESETTGESKIQISVEWESNGPPVSVSLSSLVQLVAGGPDDLGTAMPESPWNYQGSAFLQNGGFAADLEGSFISLINDRSAVINNSSSSRENDEGHIPNSSALPKPGFPVTVTFHLPAKL